MRANTSKSGASTAHAAGMRDHALHVLGVPVVFNALMVWDRVPLLPATARRLRTSRPDTRQCAAMLMPLGGELFSIYVDERQGMFVQAQDCPDSLHLLDGRWGGLRQIMPPDSACLAVAYRTRTQALVLGVYDVLRVASSDTSKLGVFERQRVLHDLSCKSPGVPEIERHWVGLEQSLLHNMCMCSETSDCRGGRRLERCKTSFECRAACGSAMSEVSDSFERTRGDGPVTCVSQR